MKKQVIKRQVWKDNTTYSRDDKKRQPRIWIYEITNKITLVIHTHVRLGETWFVTCNEIGLNMMDLETAKEQEAKDKALSIACQRLNKLAEIYKQAALSIESKVCKE